MMSKNPLEEAPTITLDKTGLYPTQKLTLGGKVCYISISVNTDAERNIIQREERPL